MDNTSGYKDGFYQRPMIDNPDSEYLKDYFQGKRDYLSLRDLMFKQEVIETSITEKLMSIEMRLYHEA